MIKKIVEKLNLNKIRTSLFIDPHLKDINLAKKIGTNCVELHTGKISNLIKKKKKYLRELSKEIELGLVNIPFSNSLLEFTDPLLFLM